MQKAWTEGKLRPESLAVLSCIQNRNVAARDLAANEIFVAGAGDLAAVSFEEEIEKTVTLVCFKFGHSSRKLDLSYRSPWFRGDLSTSNRRGSSGSTSAEVDDVFGYSKPGKIDVYAKPMSAAGATWRLQPDSAQLVVRQNQITARVHLVTSRTRLSHYAKLWAVGVEHGRVFQQSTSLL